MKTIFAIVGVLMTIILVIAEIVIYFTAVVPGDRTNFGIDWYIFCHYWHIHLAFGISYASTAILFKID